MATHHSISELLTAGAEPTQDEVRDLMDLGRFTAALFARYLSGLSGARSDAGSRHAAMVAALEGRLAHRGAGQWMAGMGLGAAQLADGWHGLWQMSAGVSEGYQRLDLSEMEVFQLLPDAIVAPYREAELQGVSRRPSLFGPRPHRAAQSSSSRPAKGSLPASTRLNLRDHLNLRDGRQVSVGVLQALAEGGLPLADQLDLGNLVDLGDLGRLTELTGPSATAKASPAAGTRRAGGRAPQAGRGRLRDAAGGRADAGGRKSRRVHLDGVEVDARTPALAGALSWAEQAFGRSIDRHAGLSISRVTTDRLLQGPARTILDAGRGEARPVFGFFDSVEGEFLSLERETAPYGAVEANTPRRADMQSPRDLPNQGGARVQRQGAGALAVRATDRGATTSPSGAGRARISRVPAGARDTAAVTTTRLSTVVPGSRGSAPIIRPESRGVFSNPSESRRGASARDFGSVRHPLAQADALPTIVGPQPSTSGSSGQVSVGQERPRPGAHRRPVAGMVATFEPGAIERGTTALFADDVVYDAAGRPRARESRGALASPRVMLRPEVDAASPVAAPHDPAAPRLGYQVDRRAGGFVSGTETFGSADTARVGVAAPVDSRTGRARADKMGGPDSRALELSSGWAAGGARWRLADDLGRDLPLGATLSSYERLAGGLAGESAASIGSGRPFRPVVASGHSEARLDSRRTDGGSPRGRTGYADSLDGVAWVALEQDGPATGSAEPALTMIPTGRRAVMVPASGALALNASVAAHRATEARGRIEGRRSESASGTIGASRTEEDRAAEGIRGFSDRAGASAPQTPVVPLTARPVVGPSGVESGRVPGGRRALTGGGQRGALVPAGTLLQDSQTGRPLGLRTSRPIIARFAGEAARGAIGETSSGSAVEAGATGPSTSAVMPARPRTRGPLEARRPAGTQEGAQAADALADWRVGARAARRALQRQSVTGREWLQTQALVGAGGPLVAGLAAAAARRSAVEPSLLTDLDSRASFASLLGGIVPADPSALLKRLVSLPSQDAVKVGRALRSAGWAESELTMLDLASELGDEGRDDSSTMKGATRTSRLGLGADRGRRQPTDGSHQAPPTAVNAAAGRGTAASKRAFERALASPELSSDTPGAARGERPGSADLSLGAGVSQSNRMARNLARILTGTASLGAGVTTSGRGGAPALSLDALLGGALGALGPRGVARDYFAGLAPARGGESTRRGTLRDAIGELLAVARAELASGRAVEPASRASLTHQLLRLDSAWRASAATPMWSAGPSGVSTSEVAGGRPGVTPPMLGRTEREALGGGPRGGYGEAERLFVIPHGDGLADRLAQAVGQSSRGPAGVDRLTRTVAGVGGTLASRTSAPAGRERSPAEPAASTDRWRHVDAAPDRLGSNRSFERRALGESVALSSVLAPEAMLGGLWSSVAGQAATGAWRGDLASELTKIEPSSEAREGDGITRPDDSVGAARAAGPGAIGSGAAGLQSVPVEGRPGAARRRVAPLREGGRRELILGRITRLLERAGVRSEAAQDLLVDSLARNVGRGRQLVAREHGAMAEFSWAWLGRVDGSRSGMDLELQGDREAFARAFSGMGGARGSSAERAPTLAQFSQFSQFSQIDEAGFVAPQSAAAPTAHAVEDRSGVRRVARAAGFGRTGASRPSHRAAEAAKQTNWRFVDTGSRASSAHADLGRLAATVLDSPDVGRRVPMPLVMPAVKAVAQSALREDASAPGANVDGAKQRADQQGQNAVDSKAGAQLSDEALEALAHEFADRIARKMKREQERRGLCR